MAGVHARVRQDQDRGAVRNRGVRGAVQRVQGVGQAGFAPPRVEQDGQRDGLEARPVDAAQRRQVRVLQDGNRQPDLPAGVGPRFEQVALGAERQRGRGDEFLADRVDGRVRHLREQLLEVVVQKLRLVGQHGQRRVRAHGADGLDLVQRHRADVDPEILEAVAEGAQALQRGFVVAFRGAVRGRRQPVEIHGVAVEPVAVRPGRHDVAFQFLVADDTALFGIDQEHAARLQAALLQHAVGRHVQHADLGAHHDQVVLRHVIARRPQPVAVEHRADARPVRERDGGRAVPRLHQAVVVFVERPLVVGHARVFLPRLGDHHHHGVGQRAAAQDEEFQAVVEDRGVAAVFQQDGKDFLQVGAERRGRHQRLAGVHPVHVAAQRVDLAVVDHVAVGVRALPTRKGVGAEARVDERNRALDARVAQVGIEGLHLVGRQHAFVDQRPARQAGHVEILAAGELGIAHGVRGAAADDVQLALEREVVAQPRGAAHENLADAGLARLGRVAQAGVVGGHVAPAQHGLAFFCDYRLQPPFAGAAPVGVRRQKHHTHAVRARLGQIEAGRGARFAQEAVRHLEQDAGAVARAFFAAAGAAVVQIDENGQTLLDDVVRTPALDVHDEADAAGVVLEAGIVEPLPRRYSDVCHTRCTPVTFFVIPERISFQGDPSPVSTGSTGLPPGLRCLDLGP